MQARDCTQKVQRHISKYLCKFWGHRSLKGGVKPNFPTPKMCWSGTFQKSAGTLGLLHPQLNPVGALTARYRFSGQNQVVPSFFLCVVLAIGLLSSAFFSECRFLTQNDQKMGVFTKNIQKTPKMARYQIRAILWWLPSMLSM